MAFFWQNKQNQLLAERDFQVTPEYTRGEYIALLIIWILILPVSVPLYLFGKMLIGIFLTSGAIAFRLTDFLVCGKRNKRSAYRWQCLRAYINTTLAAHIPHINSSFRLFLFRLTGITIGKGIFIGMHGYMEDCNPENVIFEDGVTVSFNVTFIAHGPKAGKDTDEKYIIMRKGSYIGAGSIVLPGVEIGEEATVGAGATVTKDIPAGAIAVGNPARVIKFKEGYGPQEEANSK
jgi:acetyltransferase-like isoleucine patch superfamily enzyme